MSIELADSSFPLPRSVGPACLYDGGPVNFPHFPEARRQRLWPFLGSIARQNEMKAIEIGGMPDHIHMLLALPSTLQRSVDRAVARDIMHQP